MTMLTRSKYEFLEKLQTFLDLRVTELMNQRLGASSVEDAIATQSAREDLEKALEAL